MKVKSVNVQVSAYTPRSDPGNPYKKRFASVNFLRGGRFYDPAQPYPHEYTRMSEAIRNRWKVVAMPGWGRRYHEERLTFQTKDGPVSFHRWVVDIPGVGKCWPLDRILKTDRVDVLLHTSNREAMKWGVKRLWVDLLEWRWVEEPVP